MATVFTSLHKALAIPLEIARRTSADLRFCRFLPASSRAFGRHARFPLSVIQRRALALEGKCGRTASSSVHEKEVR